MRKRWTIPEIEQFLKLYADGLSYEDIGIQLGYPYFSVKELARNIRDKRSHPMF